MLLLAVTFTNAQQMTPEQVVQQSMQSYNNRDIAGFMSVMDENITVHNFADGQQLMHGAAECKAIYEALFTASPKLHSTVLTRTVFGNKVIDHESIVGRNGSDEIMELVLIYEIKDEKIVKITVLRKDS